MVVIIVPQSNLCSNEHALTTEMFLVPRFITKPFLSRIHTSVVTGNAANRKPGHWNRLLLPMFPARMSASGWPAPANLVRIASFTTFVCVAECLCLQWAHVRRYSDAQHNNVPPHLRMLHYPAYISDQFTLLYTGYIPHASSAKCTTSYRTACG